MRLLDIVRKTIPNGHCWEYLETFVVVLLHTTGLFAAITISVVLASIPLVLATLKDSAFCLMWYIVIVPSWVVSIKFIAYHLRWDDIFY